MKTNWFEWIGTEYRINKKTGIIKQKIVDQHWNIIYIPDGNTITVPSGGFTDLL